MGDDGGVKWGLRRVWYLCVCGGGGEQDIDIYIERETTEEVPIHLLGLALLLLLDLTAHVGDGCGGVRTRCMYIWSVSASMTTTTCIYMYMRAHPTNQIKQASKHKMRVVSMLNAPAHVARASAAAMRKATHALVLSVHLGMFCWMVFFAPVGLGV